MAEISKKGESMKKQVGNKKSGNEQVRITTSTDNGKTSIEIRVYPPAGRAAKKAAPTPETSKASS